MLGLPALEMVAANREEVAVKNTDELCAAVESTFSIECAGCGDRAEATGDVTSAFGAAEDFAADGWKVVEGEVTCPDCVEAVQLDATGAPPALSRDAG